MKKIILTFALSIAMSVPAFAATNIGDWAALKDTADYEGTQLSTVAAGKSANGIVFSRHNLSSYGEHYQVTTSVTGTSTKYTGIAPLGVATTEICVFCHTPHFGRTDSAPLWNRGSAATGYTAYGASTTGTNGSTLAGTQTDALTGGSSLACLSCHDGVTTLDNMINKPGKSGIGNTGSDAGWFFGEVGEYIGDTTNMTAVNNAAILAGKDKSRLNIGGGFNSGTDAGYNTTRSVGNVDLRNDHPINLAYNGGNAIADGNVGVASLRPTSTTISSLSMYNARANDGDQAFVGNDDTLGYYGTSENLWASRGSISNTVIIADLLRDGGKVQCASCHDPHYKNQTNTDPSVVCSYFPKISDRLDPLQNGVYGTTYTDEGTTPTLEGCWTAASDGTVVKGSPVWGGGASADLATFNDHYLSDVDSDGLFLRRVGGNSNSGLCRTCHNK